MNFILIGHPCVDEIHTPSGEVIKSWGGILYTLAAMEHAVNEGDTVIPVFPIGKDEESSFRARIAGYKHVDTSCIHVVDAPTNKVKLIYKDGTLTGGREEICSCVLPPVEYDWLRVPVREASMFMVNMVSGYEITVDVLHQIRRATRRPFPLFMFLDVHALVLGEPQPDKPRQPRHVTDWENWMFNVDGVQMNADEVKYFSKTERAAADVAAEFRTMQFVTVTRGAKGASLYARDAIVGKKINNSFNRVEIPPVNLGDSRDSTGCGDVFGGAFAVFFSKTRHSIYAAQFASYLAAAKSLYPGSEGLDRLRDYVLQYPPYL